LKEEKLERYGLLKRASISLEMPKTVFIGLLAQLVTAREEKNSFGLPTYPYYGKLDHSSFEISENHKLFKATSSSKVSGTISETHEGIEVNIKAFALVGKQYIFLVAGALFFVAGIAQVITNEPFNYESLILLSIGPFIVVFTYFHMKTNAKAAIKNFEKRMQEIQERYHHYKIQNPPPN